MGDAYDGKLEMLKSSITPPPVLVAEAGPISMWTLPAVSPGLLPTTGRL
jgi:hypothetical protein